MNRNRLLVAIVGFWVMAWLGQTPVMAQSPEVSIQAYPTDTLCAGDTTHLSAEVELAQQPNTVLEIAIGDILCTDNSIVKPEAFAGSGKTAMGIVFFVDNTGAHGWAVSLHNVIDSCKWGPRNSAAAYLNAAEDVPGIHNYFTPRSAISDFNGLNNTEAIRNHYGADFLNCVAAYSAYYYDHLTDNVGTTHLGWYLPAVGQLRFLYSELPIINASLAIVNGTPFSMDTDWEYWSSSECEIDDEYSHMITAWSVNNRGYIEYCNKTPSYRKLGVRSVRSF